MPILFLAFSDLSCHLEDTRIGVFWLPGPPDSKETELGSNNQEASPSAGKNTGVVLVLRSRMEVRPYHYFQWCGYFWGQWVPFVTTYESSVRVTRINSRIGISWTLSLPFYFNQFKLNELWPYYQKRVNQIILNHITL